MVGVVGVVVGGAVVVVVGGFAVGGVVVVVVVGVSWVFIRETSPKIQRIKGRNFFIEFKREEFLKVMII